ncbi:hypothetical protein ACJJTC_019844 [Scirpophaga incertulas]
MKSKYTLSSKPVMAIFIRLTAVHSSFWGELGSLNRNFDYFLVMLRQIDISYDVIILTECWLDEYKDIRQLDGYTSYHTSLNINKAGGVVIYVKDNLTATCLEIDFDGEANSLVVDIADTITVMGVYRSPSIKNTDKFLDILDNRLSRYKQKKHFIVTGNFNIDIIRVIPDTQTNNYLNLLAEHGFYPVINKPTRQNALFGPYISKTIHPLYRGLYVQTAQRIICWLWVAFRSIVKWKIPSDRIITKIDHQAVSNDIQSFEWSLVTDSTGRINGSRILHICHYSQ